MLRTVFFFGYFWIVMILTVVVYLPYAFLRILHMKKARQDYLLWIGRLWAKHLLWVLGVKLEVEGLENLPKESAACFVSNHQGLADILIIVAGIPRNIGFIAKKELEHWPVINWWMRALGCVFIDRGKPKQALEALRAGSERIRQGYPVFLFPEGTRSRGPAVGTFKIGSLRLAYLARSPIVPMTIDGSYRVYEENKRITPARVRLIIHPPFSSKEVENSERHELAEKLAAVVAKPLENRNKSELQ